MKQILHYQLNEKTSRSYGAKFENSILSKAFTLLNLIILFYATSYVIEIEILIFALLRNLELKYSYTPS